MRLFPVIVLAACTGNPPTDDTSPVDTTVPWSKGLPSAADELGSVRGLTPARALVHVHSPFSHDACDGDGYVDGEVDLECLADLRAALCDTRTDVAFITDHPGHAAEQPFVDLLFHQEGDEYVMSDGVAIANRVRCDNGHEVLWAAGIEDIVMPVGLERHVAGDDAAENDRLLNSDSQEAMDAEHAAGGVILQNHTEGVPLDTLLARQERGLDGVETFNLHAMFAPDIREDDLGLDPFGWADGIAPFTTPDATGEPDLFFLGVHGRQGVSIDKWVALNQVAPTISVAGTDAHQNTLPLDLRDGERGDSYRRMFRWFSNTLLLDSDGPDAYEAALRAGRTYITYHALGMPNGFDVHVQDDGGVIELGGQARVGDTLTVACPVLSAGSPQGTEAPEIAVTVYRDGQPWQSDCGSYELDAAGIVHVEVTIVPHHLRDVLGDEPEAYLREFPWVQSGAIRVE